MPQNETRHQFELNNIDAQMRDAQKKAFKVVSRKEAAQMQWVNAILAAIVLVLGGTLLFLLGAF